MTYMVEKAQANAVFVALSEIELILYYSDYYKFNNIMF
jgi:hypothetical protein